MSARPDTIAEPVAQPQAPARILLTREGERELRAKLEALEEEIRVELPRRMRSAREFGDATGNDDYLQLLEEEAVTSARVRALTDVLALAKIVDSADAVLDAVAVGTTVTIRAGGKELERRLVGAYEAVGEDCVSASSPIGQAILGRSVGDEVLVELPSGAEQTLEIVAVAMPGAEPAAA
jgi:transcription elongation factor GreA